MQMSAELSLYPLASEVDSTVLEFIRELLSSNEVSAVTNSMSTQVTGPSDAVFNAVQQALEKSYERFGRQVLVAKFIPEHRMEITAPDRKSVV